jgi:cell division protein FtsW
MVKLGRSLAIITITTLVWGLIFLTSSSVVDAARDFGDKWHYIKLQAGWSLLGLLSMIFFSLFPHQRLVRFSKACLITAVIMLVLVLIPGIGIRLQGARRWLGIGIFTIQPAEFSKLLLGIYLSRLLMIPVTIAPFLIIIGLTVGLIILQPDMGTGLIILVMALGIYFISQKQAIKTLWIFPLFMLLAVFSILVSPYRRERALTFLGLVDDPQGSSYQVTQGAIALGAGGVFGRGLGNSRQKYNFLPESSTDSILAIIGEEFGFLGTSVTIGLLGLICGLGFQVVKSAADPFSKNLAAAITCLIAGQSLLNLSAITGLIPLSGVPLTFISYGGSSLFVFLTGMGILINISRKTAG